jgi:hypothetical protein
MKAEREGEGAEGLHGKGRSHPLPQGVRRTKEKITPSTEDVCSNYPFAVLSTSANKFHSFAAGFQQRSP